jgi:porphobilinogen synthase
MFPMFIAEGENVQVEIPSMPEFSPFYWFDGKEVQELFDLGIRAVNIVKVDENLKTTPVLKPGTQTDLCKTPFVPSKPLVRKCVMPDVALDPYILFMVMTES